MYKILILGPQGSGKGTQAELLAKKLGIPAISMGELWRKEIEMQTEWGKAYAASYKGGRLAPDEQTTELARRRLGQPDAQKGFVFDSYPRNISQQKLSEPFLQFNQVVVLNLSDVEAVHRLEGRRVCPICGSNYHIVFNPPKGWRHMEGWKCDEEGAELVVRSDDKPESIKERLAIYHKDTEPLIEYYRSQGLVKDVDASQSIDAVHVAIMQSLQ